MATDALDQAYKGIGCVTTDCRTGQTADNVSRQLLSEYGAFSYLPAAHHQQLQSLTMHLLTLQRWNTAEDSSYRFLAFLKTEFIDRFGEEQCQFYLVFTLL